MSGPKRMNLFREVARGGKRKAPGRRASLGLHARLVLLIVLVCSAMTARTFAHFRASNRELAAEVKRINEELAELTEAKVKEAEARPRKPASPVATAPESPATPAEMARSGEPVPLAEYSSLDGTWSALLWKIATGSEVGIALDKLDLQEVAAAAAASASSGGAPPPPTSARQVVMEGQARTLRDITSWLERLARRIPGFAFVLDHQTDSKSQDYPIGFKVIARAT